jgi:hypothetical protein
MVECTIDEISLESVLIFTAREVEFKSQVDETEDTVEAAEIPDKRAERRGVFFMREGAGKMALFDDVEDTEGGIDKSKVTLEELFESKVSSKMGGAAGRGTLRSPV